jgi:hypothetical protein
MNDTFESVFQPPSLECILINEFGDKTQFKASTMGSSIDAVVEAFKRFLLACGYTQETVDEVQLVIKDEE